MKLNLIVSKDSLRLNAGKAFDGLKPYERRHSAKVGILSEAFSREILSEETDMGGSHLMSVADFCNDMHLAGYYHDIGKICIPPILRSMEGGLNEEEMSIMKLHSEYGASILENDPLLGSRETITQAVMHHHENHDGSGYPHGISGSEIPCYAMALRICDSFDAIMGGRRYKGRLFSFKECREDMMAGSGEKYEPEMLKVFFERVVTRDVVNRLYGLQL